MSEDRRKELGAFLRARRGAIAPDALGYPPARRRRTPGLRREELASAAGVGITWYTWLEQGRDIRTSQATLLRICRSLQLSPADVEYAFLLAGLPYGDAAPSTLLTPSLAAVFQAYEGAALYLDPMWNVLAHNGVARVLYDLDKPVGPFESNQVWQAFRNPRRRRLYVDFEHDMRSFVGLFRRASAAMVDDQEFRILIGRLVAESAEFATLWRQRETAPTTPITVRLAHPRFGEIAVDSVRIPVEGGNGAMVLFIAGADPGSEQAFRRVAAELRADPAPVGH